ncbi:potassium channel family protein [Undibacterium sp. WLX3042]|uniref:potassium channel family protein n=1 Tax=Undibacterium sp. WLX3042 TaxID=3412686 RepID=UPI003C2C0C96
MAKTIHSITKDFLSWFARPLLFSGLLLSIPAFYLLMMDELPMARTTGHALYACVALFIVLDMYIQYRKQGRHRPLKSELVLDAVIAVACLVCSLPLDLKWSTVEWLLRLALCAVILLRISMLVLRYVKPSHLVQIILLALFVLSAAGGGFYWLEPGVKSYADGVWLAFTTVATVGYGDMVPSTPASKIFAVFIVLLGYALFSVVTANIAVLFVGEEEEMFERELQLDIRALRQEVAALRQELHHRDAILRRLEHYINDRENSRI